MLNHTTEKSIEIDENIAINDYCRYDEFMDIIQDLIQNPIVKQMRNFNQHANTSC